MPRHAFASIMQHLRSWSRPGDEEDDGPLLGEFMTTRDEEAFATVLRRHGPMVMGVCRRVLGSSADADDVFQATFLVLIRRAGVIRRRDSLGCWLHGVAFRLACRARADTARRRDREAQSPPRISSDSPRAWSDLRPILDEELNRLPEKYRRPLLLCYFEGRTQAEAAAQLGWPMGTVSGRLARARTLLKSRLVRRGVTLAVGAALLPLDDVFAEVPPTLAATTTRLAGLLAAPEAALTALASPVARLVDGATKATSPGRWKLAGAALALLAALTAGVGVVAHQRPAAPPANHPVASDTADRPRLDAVGDLLPADAVFRLGTLRWRHDHTVSSLAFLPDGRVVSGCWDGTVRIWDAESGRELARWQTETAKGVPSHEAAVSSVAASPDGKTVVSGGMDKALHFWDVATGRELYRSAGHENTVMSLAWSPDGKMLVSGSGNAVRRWGTTTLRELPPLPRCSDGVSGLRFSPDGKLLAVACRDKSIKLYNPESAKETRTALVVPDKVGGVCFSPDGACLAAACADKSVRIFDMSSGREVRAFSNLEVGRGAFAFTRDGRRLMAGDMDGVVVLLDIRTGREVRRTPSIGEWAMAIALSPDGKTFAGAFTQRALRRWDAATGEELRFAVAHEKRVAAVAVSPDGRTVATGGYDRRVVFWDTASGHPSQTELTANGDVNDLAYSPDGALLACACGDKTVRVWNTVTHQEVRRLTNHTDRVTRVAFSPDGLRLASRSWDKTARVWDPATGKELAVLTLPVAPHYEAKAIAFSPDGITLAVDAGDRAIHLFDLTTHRQRETFRGSAELVHCLAFGPDGRTLVSGGYDGRIIVWNLANGAKLRTIDAGKSGVESVAFSPDGRELLACSARNVCLWEVASGRLRHRFVGHAAEVAKAVYSPDGRWAVSGSEDTTALVWEIRPKTSAAALTPAELDARWADLADADAEVAFAAMRRIAASPLQAILYLRGRLKPPPPIDEGQFEESIAHLGDGNFRVRDRASRDLEQLEESARPLFEKALQKASTPEMKQRLKALLARLDQTALDPPPKQLRMLRAAEALAWIEKK